MCERAIATPMIAAERSTSIQYSLILIDLRKTVYLIFILSNARWYAAALRLCSARVRAKL